MTIKNVTASDIEKIFALYKIASNYQREKKTVIVWPDFDREMVINEIAENRQFKLLVNNEVVCIWAITFSDEQIWEDSNTDSAVYIHRIAVNPNFRGNNYIATITNWAKEYALKKEIQFIRLDTLGENKNLITHYKNAGFHFLGLFNLKNTSNLPEHYKLAPVCLFEIDLYKN
ncbi:GNAT family N-acetyltransferase [uncultured Polaribacter sp.]|uniref:GNAT family N-acetyltransferase n=1 Tax=uncultured Polaribacter sp. TaxID=174711 RepID=UPI0037041E6E